MTMGKPLLRVDGVETFYGRSQALFGMSLEVSEGEVVTLIGRNGMGKTTTVNSIMGILPIAGGLVEFRGEEIQYLSSHLIARRGLGLVPEGRHVFPNLTVIENLVATANSNRDQSSQWTLDKVLELFPLLEERRNSMGNLLSGGEQQMLVIGRALMTNPELLILDEATEGLAPLVRQEIWRVLAMLKEQGQSILVIDKNIRDLTRIADRHFIMEKGISVWTGTSTALASDKSLTERYLGV